MIVLITGASHTGKTLLAQRMLEKYRCIEGFHLAGESIILLDSDYEATIDAVLATDYS